MTATVREQIIEALIETLSDIDDITVERSRLTPVQHYPSVVLRDGEQSSAIIDSESKQHAMQIEVEGYVQAADSSAVSSAMNDLYGKIVSALLADDQIGGLANDLREVSMTPILENESGKRATAAFMVLFEVEYQTGHADPYSTAP